jgi:hypothetical protein
MSFRFRRNRSWVVAFATMLALAALTSGVASADPTREHVYVDGQTYQINTVSPPIFDVGQTLLDLASPIYILGYPVPAGTSGPITLPSGYQPQHNGFPPSPIPYHDHVLVALPGDVGYVAPLRVVQLSYTSAHAYSTDFVPVTSYDELAAGEAAGIFQVINPGAVNPYEIWTTTVLIRPVVMKNS